MPSDTPQHVGNKYSFVGRVMPLKAEDKLCIYIIQDANRIFETAFIRWNRWRTDDMQYQWQSVERCKYNGSIVDHKGLNSWVDPSINRGQSSNERRSTVGKGYVGVHTGTGKRVTFLQLEIAGS
jgi:hypothetical protein